MLVSALIDVFALLVSFYALARITDEYFVSSLEMIAKRNNMPSDIAGATLMAMGSSAPELFTSLLALVKTVDLGDLGAGTIVGSAVFNVLVIIGVSAIVTKVVLTWQPVLRDLLFYVITIGILYMVFHDGWISLGEAWILVAFYVVYLIALPLWRKIFPYANQEDALNQPPAYIGGDLNTGAPNLIGQCLRTITSPIRFLLQWCIPNPRKKPHLYVVSFFNSVILIALFSWVLVEAGVHLATLFNIPKTIVAITILAVGTSVPDLLASLVSAKQGRGDMAVSNAIGSNIFDILVGLGLVWVVIISITGHNIPIGKGTFDGSIVLLLGTVVLLFVTLILGRWKLSRALGGVLVTVYVVYLSFSILQVGVPESTQWPQKILDAIIHSY